MISQTDIRTFYELQPIVPLSEGWQILAFTAGVFLLLSFVIWMYLRDCRDLPRGLTVLLSSLRILAFVCILIYVLNPGKRSESRIVKTSRLSILVDTSLSMGLQDQPSGGLPDGQRRIDQVVDWIGTQSEIETLRTKHDLTFYRFGEQSRPEMIATVAKTPPEELRSGQTRSQQPLERLQRGLQNSRQIGWLAIACCALALAMGIGWFFARLTKRSGETRSWFLCAAVFGIAGTAIGFAWCDLESPRFDLWSSLGWKPAHIGPPPAQPQSPGEPAGENEDAYQSIQWAAELAPKGTSTHLGSAIQYIVNKERGGPIAGIVVLTDGRSNSGIQPARAIASSANAGIPIFPIGIGSTSVPKNIQVADIQAPPKVIPSDPFLVKGIVKSFGLEGSDVRVQLISVDEKEQEAEAIEDETSIRLLGDGEPTPVEFNVSQKELGRRRYTLRVEEIPGDLDLRDNQRATVVEIVERQTKVLLIAGGPNRDFRFLRNQLFRDKDVLLHVWLQSSEEGADQEADVLVEQFPQTRELLFYYDCIIAFDPDWRQLNRGQAELLERWVAEQAGGLILIAGPVNTPEWTRRPRGDEVVDKIRRLYPVSFYSQGTAQLKLGRFGGDEPFPLDFSREGRAAEFLWLGDTASESQANWGTFEGVFGYYAVNEPKPGADVLAHFSDPSTSVNDQLAIYLASQFYGAGRVFFQASGEMWRVRRLDDEYFQKYYTKLIRWASQGRMLRDSTRGVLLTDRQRCWVGDQIVIQAILQDAQDEPLVMPKVLATIALPNGATQQVELVANENAVRSGTFQGQFTAANEGDFGISLSIPGSPDLEVLTASVQANIPDLEKEKPQRNDALMIEMSDKTNGHFYVGTESFYSDKENPFSPDEIIPAQDQETFLTGTQDRFFQRKLMMWLLALTTMALTIEWTVRRLHKLA